MRVERAMPPSPDSNTSIERPASVARAPAPLLSVVVPTFNEARNVAEIVRRLEQALAGIDWEVVFVDDDSTDGTTAMLREAARSSARVRVLHRIGRRGLSTAVVEGIMSVSSPYVAVMDGDLQHDESRLAPMLEQLRASGRDIIVGSRYMAGGGVVRQWGEDRQAISRLATRLARLVLREPLSDPMSGFFMLRREAFDRAVRRLSGVGYKILLDILISARPPLAVAEIPYEFRTREQGHSKLDTAVAWEYLVLLLDKTVGRVVPIRFVMFVLVGGAGVVVHMLTLAALTQGSGLSFLTSQTAATVLAMTFNFFANNVLTYRDQRLRGAANILIGLFSFYLVCSVGAISNVGIAAFLFLRDYSWWLSGFAGIIVGAVWNYAASSIFTWRTR
jgi:dolichol-phosphate mannosyltransferase